jgi:hypothetical protein
MPMVRSLYHGEARAQVDVLAPVRGATCTRMGIDPQNTVVTVTGAVGSAADLLLSRG